MQAMDTFSIHRRGRSGLPVHQYDLNILPLTSCSRGGHILLSRFSYPFASLRQSIRGNDVVSESGLYASFTLRY